MAISNTDFTPPLSATTAANSAAVPQNPNASMGKDSFMKLLVQELKSQDPTDPVNAREMITQLSQLSSVEKLTSVDSALAAMQAQNTASASIQSAGLVGRTVTADTNRMNVGQLGGANGQYQLPSNAEDVSIRVTDSKGNVVRTLDAGKQSLGTHGFTWDGNDETGIRVASGSYQFSIAAVDAAKNPVAATTRVSGVVTQVSYENGAAELVVGDTRVGFGDVISIGQ
jgi:flagellar basal-body rod modification protein FlgD